MEHIGQIEIKSGRIFGTDPCYDKDTWCTVTINNCKNGKYNSYIDKKDGRISKLFIVHVDHDNEDGTRDFNDMVGNGGVDSGQFGFFDFDSFPKEGLGEHNDINSVYRKICEGTCSSNQYSIDTNYVVSSSGWGDGGYDVSVMYGNNEQVVGILVDYIHDDNYDDYEPDYDIEDDF